MTTPNGVQGFAIVGCVPKDQCELERHRAGRDGEDATTPSGTIACHKTEVHCERIACNWARPSTEAGFVDPSAGPRSRVVIHLAPVHGQDSAVGDAEVEVADATTHTGIRWARAVTWSRVVVHRAKCDRHGAVIEDAAACGSWSRVAVHQAKGDVRVAPIGNATGTGHWATSGRVAVHLTEKEVERAVRRRSGSPVAVTAGDPAAPTVGDVVIHLAEIDAESAAVVEDATTTTAHSAGKGGIPVHLASIEGHGAHAGYATSTTSGGIARHIGVIEGGRAQIHDCPAIGAVPSGNGQTLEREVPARRVNLKDAEGRRTGRASGDRRVEAVDGHLVSDRRQSGDTPDHRDRDGGSRSSEGVRASRGQVDGPASDIRGVDGGDQTRCST